MNGSAKWITSPVYTGSAVLNFRKNFDLSKTVQKAELFATSLGVYVPCINGKRVGRNVLAPGFTSYNQRILYQQYDVTSLLCTSNCLEFGVGVGWAVGYMGFFGDRHHFAEKTSLIAWLDLTYTDGEKTRLITDESWDVFTSQVTFAEIYHGETVDKTALQQCLGKAVLSDLKTQLVPQDGEWITEHECLAPVKLIHTPKGETVIDFGQNLAGYVSLKIKGPRGGRVVLHHGEVLDEEGNFYKENTGISRNEVTFILSGEEDTFKPAYSFQGFRYIHLVEYPLEQVDLNGFRAIAVYSNIKRTGSFACGNAQINQLYHNVLWGQRSNFLDIPTDCPQRAERLGWTGDAQVFCRTAAINFDVERFFGKWLRDMALEQEPSGAVRGIVPNCFPKGKERGILTGWGDAACIIPWQVYLAYGNKELLKEHYPMMKKWVEYIRGFGPEEALWLQGRHIGDWLSLNNDETDSARMGVTSTDLIASAYYAYSTKILAMAGDALGEDSEAYWGLHKKIVRRFREYFLENGLPKERLPITEPKVAGEEMRDKEARGVTQTALVLILYFGLCEETERPVLAAKLAQLIHDFGDRLTTGILSTPYILFALSENGYTELAYTLLLQEKCPSWLYAVNHGATTMWERWNGLSETGKPMPDEMNSFNHYAYGSVYAWIFSVVAGIQTVAEAPAYKKILLQPHPHKALGFVDASIESRNGFIRSHWYYKGDTVYYEFTIPQGVTAQLCLPSGYTATLAEGTYHFAQ